MLTLSHSCSSLAAVAAILLLPMGCSHQVASLRERTGARSTVVFAATPKPFFATSLPELSTDAMVGPLAPTAVAALGRAIEEAPVMFVGERGPGAAPGTLAEAVADPVPVAGMPEPSGSSVPYVVQYEMSQALSAAGKTVYWFPELLYHTPGTWLGADYPDDLCSAAARVGADSALWVASVPYASRKTEGSAEMELELVGYLIGCPSGRLLWRDRASDRTRIGLRGLEGTVRQVVVEDPSDLRGAVHRMIASLGQSLAN